MKRVALTAALVAASTAHADPDLRVKQLPAKPGAKLAMRARTAAAPQPGSTTSAPLPAPADSSTSTSASFKPIPTSLRDLQERVSINIRAGFDLEGAPSSGTPIQGGAALPSGFSNYRPWIVGDAMVGARDLLLPSLGGYLLSSFQFDASDALATRAGSIVPGDATDQRIAIKAGYAEWGTDPRAANPNPLWLRAGRQFRLDGGGMFAYFDGLTAGYRGHAFDASAFVGQRVALYVDTPTGITFGATAALDLKKAIDVPLKLALDAMGLAIDAIAPGSTAAAPTTASQLRDLVALSAHYEPNAQAAVDLRARGVDGGAGFAFGRAGARVRYEPSRELLIVGDLEQRGGGDLAYDLASPSAVDVVNISRQLGIGLAAPVSATTVGARVDWRRATTELLAFARADLPNSTATNVAQAGWVEGGAAVAGTPLGVAWTTAQYTYRQYLLDDSANQMGSAFDNTAGSGLERLHELALDSVFHRQTRGGKKWRASAGVFARVYDVRSPYVTVTNDLRAGGRGDLQFFLTRELHAQLAAEIAQSSPTLARELGPVSSVRAVLEARW